jgi:hypothetical protein
LVQVILADQVQAAVQMMRLAVLGLLERATLAVLHIRFLQINAQAAVVALVR